MLGEIGFVLALVGVVVLVGKISGRNAAAGPRSCSR